MPLTKSIIEDNIGTIFLDNYKKRNVFSSAFIHEFLINLNHIKEQKVKVVVIRTEGMHSVWSAGHDVTELPQSHQEPLPYSNPFENLLRTARQFPIPMIAMIHGSVWGGAFDFVMNCCDLIIGDETASFAITPAKLGVPYNASGIQQFLKRIPVNIVKEMFFTAEPLSAERALQYGILNHLVPESELEKRTYHIAKTICSRSSGAISAFKAQSKIILDTCPINPENFEYIEQLRSNVYHSEDYIEGVAAFLEGRSPKFK